MRRIIKKTTETIKFLVSYWWKKQIVVYGTLAAIAGFADAFGLIPEAYGWEYFIATIVVGFFIAVIWGVIDRIDDGAHTGTDIENREGSRRSLSLEYVDSHHKITSLLRQDLLDYVPSSESAVGRGGDFTSFRVIKGRNVGALPTDGFTYFECSEYKLFPKDVIITAFDLKTNRELRVDFINRDSNERYFEFPFKIRFTAPLAPREEFEIAYSITLTNELNVLRDDDELMSVSLTRYPKGVEDLEFNVCLNFEPKSAQAEYQRGNKFFLHDTKVMVEKYTPTTDLEQLFDIQWSEQPYIIRWKCHKPNRELYVIKYRR